jgi:hypothetical protein
VASIDVTVAGALAPEQIERLANQGARQRLQDELTKQLFAAGRFGENGELRLSVQIVEFRLRSPSAVRWAGAMAGPDLLGITARVARFDVEMAAFDTGVSTTIVPSLSYANEEVRLDRMVVELARRIIARLPTAPP